MIDIADRLKIIEQLVQDGDINRLRYAALECRLALEEICYERLRIAHKYIPIERVRSWQPPKLLKFLSEELETSILGGSKISISAKPVDGLKELKREDYEAMEWLDIGQQSLLDVKKISKLYQKIAKHLHAEMPRNQEAALDDGHSEIKRHIREVVEELTEISKGKIEFFWPLSVVSFECICGEEISRTEHSLQNAAVVSCMRSTCKITYEPRATNIGYELVRRAVMIKCPYCPHNIPQEFADVEKLSLGQVYTSSCPECKRGIKITPAFKVTKDEA
jgi:hypothetical protein